MFKKNIPYLGFNDFWFVLIGIPTVGFLMPMLFFNESLRQGLPYLGFWAEATIFTIVFWLGVRQVFIIFRKRYPLLKDTTRRIILQILTSVGYAMIAKTITSAFCDQIFGLLRGPKTFQFEGTVGTYGMIFLVMAIYEAIYFYSHLKISIEEKEQAKQAQLFSELQGLRNQVNPHFLFNSLNTLMSIVVEDQQLAVSFLKKLSRVYRYVLENREDLLVPLQEELHFMESYIFLQKERFQTALQVHIDIPEKYEQYRVVPMAMQILFENAVKHNVVSARRVLHIDILVENDKLIMKNNLQRRRTVMDSTKLGLENVKSRYKIFTDQEVEILEDEETFSVAIPLLEPVFVKSEV